MKLGNKLVAFETAHAYSLGSMAYQAYLFLYLTS